MKKYTLHTSNEGYSIIAAILMIGFLLILTVGTLNLVLSEMQDGRWRQNYMKSYAGAEGAMELWLLQIKKEGYGVYDSISESTMLWSAAKDAKVWYDFTGRVNSYNGSLSAYEVDIIPLFWIDTSGSRHDISSIDFTGLSSVAWNILGTSGGVSWIWNMNNATIAWEKAYDDTTGDLLFDNSQTVGSFLSSGENYLIIHNTSSVDGTYSLNVGSGDYFTLPRWDIISTWKVWKYSQNLQTTVDNTEFLWILKYSIYSPN